jgi:hypothetical protein
LAASLSQGDAAVKVKTTVVNTREGSPAGGRLSLAFSIVVRRFPSYNRRQVGLGWFMERLRATALLICLPPFIFGAATFVSGQTTDPVQLRQQSMKASPASQSPDDQKPAVPLDANAPRITKQTRLEIIRDFETQMVYSRAAFPMGTKGLKLKNGGITPSGVELQQALALWGPAVKPGDPAHISFVQIKDDHIRFEINGGPVHRKKWYQHVTVSGANGATVGSPDESQANPHGSFVDLYFEKYVPELSAQQVRDLLFPVLDFKAKNKEQAYLDTVPPKVKEAILAHNVLVGMNQEMVIHAKGRPPKKVREKDGETEYEEWIYGEPPQDVDFVRIASDEVVRVETMKVGGQKILRTEKEVVLERPDRDQEAKKEQQDRPANAPSLRRPGEDSEDAPKPANGQGPLPQPTGPPIPSPPPGGAGPGSILTAGR